MLRGFCLFIAESFIILLLSCSRLIGEEVLNEPMVKK